MTFLAIKRKVSASTQNQAFNALLFFYRHVIKKDFENLKDTPRAKRKPYIPVVLSREEIGAIFKHNLSETKHLKPSRKIDKLLLVVYI